MLNDGKTRLVNKCEPNLGARLFKIFPPAIGLVPFRGALWGPEIPKMEELFKRLDMMEHLGAKGQGWWFKPAGKLVVSLHIPSFSKSFSPKLENDMWISDWFMNFKGQTRDECWRCRLGELETISYGALSPQDVRRDIMDSFEAVWPMSRKKRT